MASTLQSVKEELAKVYAVANARHRSAENPFRVVQGFAQSVDGILLQLFVEFLEEEQRHVALLAVGGYGRRELCPQSDIDILFVREDASANKRIEKLVRFLWDSGFQLGHAVRTVKECYESMLDDINTATALLESRFLVGEESLLHRFEAQCVNRYLNRRAEAFARRKLDLLRESLEDPQRTIYVIEPNLKEGACGLRDIQRVLWVQNIRRQGGTFRALREQRSFSPDEVNRLEEAYAFYLRTRCELHFTNRVRQDVLERDSQVTVARNLGYGAGQDDRAAVEGLMGDYYRHARNVYRFLKFYLETGTKGRRFLDKISRRFFSSKHGDNLSCYKGRIFLLAEPQGGGTAEEILGIFAVAQKENARLSEAACDWIRRRVSAIQEDMAHGSVVLRAFVGILRAGRGVGRLLKSMHETGVLSRILPEFGKLECMVNFDGHHQFTVDEHTLKTLEELDRIEEDPNYHEAEFRQVLLETEDRLPLRVALLLHDLGKSIPGKHSVSGTETAVLLCERLGLDEKMTETVEFLVYRHLELFRVSERLDFREEEVVESLAALVENEERLKMLYLLTYIDITSVGPGTWTRWKGAQLAELYQRTLIRLRTGALPAGNLEAALEAAGLDSEQRLKIADHCSKLNTPVYVREIVPERMLLHVKLVEDFLAKGEIQVAADNAVGYHGITFCGRDRPRLFADFAGLLFSEGFNVLGARIFTRDDGIVLDVFQVEVADTINIGFEERLDRLRKKLRGLENKAAKVEDYVRQRTMTYRLGRWQKPLFGPSVTFDNDASGAHTVIEVSAGDRPGLLYDLALAISRLGLDVRTAKVSTLADRAHDVFYVREANGAKVEDGARRTAIQKELVTQAQRSPAEPR